LDITALKHSPSKRKPGERGPRTQSMNEDVPGRVPAQLISFIHF